MHKEKSYVGCSVAIVTGVAFLFFMLKSILLQRNQMQEREYIKRL